MANSDKNIRIETNKGKSGYPNIAFIGSTNDPIYLYVLDDNTISFEGSTGQLFSVSNSVTSGTIFSVNDISGIPSLRIDADGTVGIAEFSGNVGVGTVNPLYKLDVNGDINAGAGRTYRIGGTRVLDSTTLGSSVVNSSLTGFGTVTSGTWNGSTIGILYGGTGATTAADARTNLSAATAGTNSDITVLNALQRLLVTIPTATGIGITVRGATSQTGNLQQWQNSSATNLSWINSSGTFNFGAALTHADGRTPGVSVQASGAAGIVVRGFNSDGYPAIEVQNNPGSLMVGLYPSGNILGIGLTITGGTASTNTTTGAARITGGVGIGGSLYVGGVSGFTSATASTSSATGGVVFSGGIGVGLTSYFASSVFIQGATASGSTSTGALVVTGGVGIGGSLQVFGTIDVADNIEVLAQKEVRFFNSGNTFYTGLRSGASSANVTFTLPIADGSANQALITNGSAALGFTSFLTSAITSLNGLTAATQTFATGTSGSDFNISSTTSTHTFNIPYAGAASTGLITTLAQTIAGAKTFSSALTVSASTSSTGFSSGALTVFGGVGISENINVNGTAKINSSTASTSSTSGALVVTGGIGIGQTSYFASDEYVQGRLYFNQATVGNAGTTVSPSIAFIGQTNNPITLSILADNSLSFEGSSGQLFSINNNLSSGTIFSVNDISGLPILRANANGTLSMAEFGTSVGVGTSLPGFKLHVMGDVNIGTGYTYRINGTKVIDAISLGSAVVSSSLTSVGTLTSGTWNATTIGVVYGGTGQTSYTDGQLLIGSSTGGTLIKSTLTAGSGILITNASGAITVSTTGAGITNLNGLSGSSQTLAVGSSGSDFNISSTGSSHTFNIPDASASNRGLVTTGTQTLGGNKTFANDVTVTGNLTVNGTTTTVNSTVSTLVDPVFTLGTATGGTNPGTDDNKDRGIEFKYFSGTAKTGFFGFDDSTGFFTFIPDAANSSEVFSGTTGVIDATRITGTAAAWTNPITFSLGGDLSGSVSFSGTGNTTLTATIAANSVALGTDTTGQYASTIAISGSGITATTAAGDDGTAYTIYSSAVSTNTASSIVLRDGSGNFSAETITANLTGTATSATNALKLTTVGASGSGTHYLLFTPQNGGSGLAVSSSNTLRLNLSSNTLLANIQGNADTSTTASFADQLTTPRTISLGGDLSGSVIFSGAGNTTLTATIAANSVALGTDTTGQYAETITISGSGITATSAVASDGTGYVIYSSAVSTNTSSAIVLRDGSGNFSAGTITASLTGTASTSTNTTTTALSGTMYLTGTLISGAASGGTALQVGSGLSFVSSTGTLFATTFSGALSGTATSSQLLTTTTDTTSTLYLLGTRSNGGFAGTAIYVDTGISALGNTLTATTFVGSLTGTATTATNATNVIFSADTTNTNRRLLYSYSGTGSSGVFNTGTLFVNPSTSAVGASIITATSSLSIRPGIDAASGVSIGNSAGTAYVYFDTTNNRVGINTATPQYDLHIIGELSATNKSFVIDHPTKEGMHLRYGSLEGPENGVYVRGRLKNKNTIELPDYWVNLVDYDSITVTLTPIGRFSELYVENIENNIVYVQDNCLNLVNCYFTVYAERIDIPKLLVEY
jgi:hypothetical protein